MDTGHVNSILLPDAHKWRTMMMLLVFCVAHKACRAASDIEPTTTTVWQPIEFTFTSSTEYAQPAPWMTLQLNASLIHVSSGTILTLPGFWDGNTSWKVRFSPPMKGAWNYSTAFTDKTNSGLHKQEGEFTATAYTGTNPLYIHGILRPSATNRYLEHADGTPFYWLGDTHWSGFSSAEHWSDTDNTSFDGSGSMFKEMVDVRAKQGYTVWKAETFVINGNQGGGHGSIANDGGPAWGADAPGFVELNPGFWQAIDRRVAYVNSRGIVVSLAYAGIGRGMPDTTNEPVATALARYAVARYSAFSTVWTTCQEYCANGDVAAWGRVAKLQYELDPLKRSTSLHNCAQNPIPPWRNESWYGHVTLQQGHNIASPVDHWLSQYYVNAPRPLFEDEANYELLKYAHMSTNVAPWLARQSAWQSQVGGAAGYTYGGQGIWWACYNRSYINGNCGPNGVPGYFTWDQALTGFEVGGSQMSYMAAFFQRLPWHTLVPDAEAISWHSPAPGANTSTSSEPQGPFQKASPSRDYIVAYLPQIVAAGPRPSGQCRPRPPAPGTAAYGATIHLAPTDAGAASSASHRVSWFNPRTGTYAVIAAALPAGTASFDVNASRPNGDVTADWVLLVEPASAPRVPTTQRHTPQPPPWEHRHTSREHRHTSWEPNAVQSWVMAVSSRGRVRQIPSTVGCAFTTPKGSTAVLAVTALCRFAVPGSQNIEHVELWDRDAKKRVLSAPVDMLHAVPDARGFICVNVSATQPTLQMGVAHAAAGLILQSNTTYVLAAANDGCDPWYDDAGTVLATNRNTSITNVYSVYGDGITGWTPGAGGTNHCYGPVNFLFRLTGTARTAAAASH
eukprot:m.296443 g.296443  ORF g.296443 m.296443 type:complete len:846 (+) comp20062_c0_seq2:121-2658(+)